MTNRKRIPFNAGEFSSRKLLDLLDHRDDPRELSLDPAEREAVVQELSSRRHYMRELRDRGLLAPRAR